LKLEFDLDNLGAVYQGDWKTKNYIFKHVILFTDFNFLTTNN